MAISTSFTYSLKVLAKAKLASKDLYNFVCGFTKNGGSITAIEIENIASLNIGCCNSSKEYSKTGGTSLLPSSSKLHLGLPKFFLITSRCFQKLPSYNHFVTNIVDRPS